ncbi:MAG: peptidoglycan DD-metalloendopeptidase family protein [Myxococcota bacterium]
MTLIALVLLASHSLLEDVEAIDRRLFAAERALEESSSEHEALRTETSRLQGDLASARLRHAEIMKTYRSRIRALARMPSGARLVMLGHSNSMREYLRTSKLLRRVAEADRRIAKARQDEESRIRLLEAAAVDREKRATQLEHALRERRDALANLRAEKIAFVSALSHDPSVSQRLRREAIRAKAALSSRVKSLAPAGRLKKRFSANQRRLPWPASGTVTVRFGDAVESEFGTRVEHSGLDIVAQAGNRVQSVGAGTVVYADWMRGYGQLVIVDHGEGYHSLYAHLKTIDVAVGTSVEPQTQIGTLGDSGSMRGTLLYFEIRHAGNAVDPSAWLRPD